MAHLEQRLVRREQHVELDALRLGVVLRKAELVLADELAVRLAADVLHHVLLRVSARARRACGVCDMSAVRRRCANNNAPTLFGQSLLVWRLFPIPRPIKKNESREKH